jgi:hypothetical protein
MNWRDRPDGSAVLLFLIRRNSRIKALKFFYYTLGDRLWGPYGVLRRNLILPKDGRRVRTSQTNQGPIIVMIENYRTGLLWNLFMSAPEVQQAATELDFTY